MSRRSVEDPAAFNPDFDYRVVRSAEATQPRIDVDIHEVKVVLPGGDETNAKDLLIENLEWVQDKREKYERYRAMVPDRSFEEGAVFPLLGDDKEIRVRPVDGHHVMEESIVLAEDRVESGSVRDELEKLYRQRARSYVTDRLETYADLLDVDYDRVEFRNQRTRWASCSPNRILSVNWRLIMAPPEIVDYIVIHELVHLVERDHTRRFWSIVKELDPDYREHRRWLEENSSRLIFTEDDL